MQSDYYINLHFNQAVAQRTGYAFKIGDKGCTFHLHCEDLDPSGMFPHIVFNHPNNTCVEGVPTGSGRDYAYTIAGNEFGVCGKTVVDLKFYDNNNDATQRISTASFMIEIIPDTYTDFEESSSSYADSLERAREEIDAAILDLQGAEHDLEEAEGDLDDMSGQFADTLQDYIDAFGNTAPINPRGEYDPNEQYVPRDAVEYTAGGKTLTYINRSACTGIAPTDPDEGAAHWQIMIDVSVGGSFSALSDVSVDPQTLADGQVPVYDATGQTWKNKTILEDSLTSTATDKALTAAKGKELQDNKQDKELDTAITIDGTSKTTVETALSGLNAYSDKLKGLLSNENLLDNPWFTVNQRGATGAISTYGTYVSDRWKLTAYATVTVAGNTITLSTGAQISQRRETGLVSGKTYTLSIKLSNGDIEHATGTYNGEAGKVFINNANFEAGYVSAGHDIYVYAKSEKTITAVKLELGSVSTLENDAAPDYTNEWLKCRRHFKRINAGDIGIGIASSTSLVDLFVANDVPMYTDTPNVTFAGTLSLQDTSGTITGIMSVKYANNANIRIRLEASNVTAGAVTRVNLSNNGYIDLEVIL